MASTFKWLAPEAIVTYFTVELNGIANGAQSANGVTVANETDLFQFINFEVNLASLTPIVGGFVSVILVPTLDGVNFADANINFLDRIVATMGLRNLLTAQRVMKENVHIAPLNFQMALYNAAGVALNAAGNTLKYRRHNGQVV